MYRLGWIISAFLSIVIIYLLTNFESKDSEIFIEKIYQDSSYVEYGIKLKEGKPLVIGLIKDGSIRSLSNEVKGFQQKLDFHDNGFLAVKTKVDSLDLIQDGRYFFFESNGNLSHNYNYQNGKKVGVARSYYPDTHYLKEYMEYDSLGRMYYRKTFDKEGNTINIEGY